MIIKGKCSEGMELDIKRCYLPGIVIEDNCPKCGAVFEMDMEDNYLSYPQVGEPEELSAYCQECNHAWTLGKVILKLSLEEYTE